METVLEIKKFQQDQERSNKEFQAQLEHSNWRAVYDAANTSGRTSVNALFLASGGAIVALLAFLGNFLSKDTSRDYIVQTHNSSIARSVVDVLEPFAWSMVLAVVSTAFIYLSMFSYTGSMRARLDNKEKASRCYNRLGTLFNWLAIATGTASLLMLAWGAYTGLNMLHKL